MENRSDEEGMLKEIRDREYRLSCTVYHKIKATEMKTNCFDANLKSKHYWSHRLYLNFQKSYPKKFIKSLHLMKLFNVPKINLNYIGRKNKCILNFLKSSLPDEVHELCMHTGTSSNIPICYYFKQILRINHKVLKKVSFIRFSIKRNQLMRLMVSFKHVKVFCLSFCKLSIPEPFDLSKSMQNTQIVRIDLYNTGGKLQSDWEHNQEEFKTLIESLATSPALKTTFKEIDLTNCGLTKSEARLVVQNNGFEVLQVQIIS
ncbi:unnamed protein product [Moneuplotes crassus]|uniref:Uncharacterized protein n=1 Tax=Euplotes crassus TaxID=5936 RepID=A0AAD2CW51_EUPCR|nr:unnamed protein product [Moneuplotes crassus]